MNRTLGALTACLLTACVAQPQSIRAGLVNPASAYCHVQGGRTLMGYTAEGQQGLCYLPDGSLIDEWELYRRDHPCE